MSSEKKYKVWIISDGAVGRRNQCLGVAERWNSEIDIIKIKDIESAGGLKPYLLEKRASLSIGKKWPDIILSSGDASCEIALKMKNLSLDTVFIASTETFMAATRFDFMAINRHEKMRVACYTMDNVIGVPHRVTDSYMQKGMDKWKSQEDIKKIIDSKKLIVGVLVGGDPSPDFKFDIKEAEDLGHNLNKEIKNLNAALLLTNSPRITVPVWRKFREAITDGLQDFFVHDCRQHSGNPYSAMLGFSSVLASTGDSVSMCYEAAAAKKPVYILTPPSIIPDLYRKIHQDLYDRGLAQEFKGSLKPYDISQAQQLDETGRVANKIKELLDKHLSQSSNRNKTWEI